MAQQYILWMTEPRVYQEKYTVITFFRPGNIFERLSLYENLLQEC